MSRLKQPKQAADEQVLSEINIAPFTGMLLLLLFSRCHPEPVEGRRRQSLQRIHGSTELTMKRTAERIPRSSRQRNQLASSGGTRVKRLLQNALLAALIPAFAGAAPPAPQLNIVNVMPAFWKAWDTTEGRPMANRISAYKSLVLAPNMAVYGFDEFSRNRSDDAIGKYLRALEPHLPKMRALSYELAQQLPAYESSFVRQMPGFDSGRVVIYFMPSFFHFEGQTHDLGSKTGVLFGLDGMAAFDTDVNPGVVAAHELYHIYQFEMHPGAKTSDALLWQAVWGEGSAAYASQMLTPGATKAQALGRTLAATNSDNIRRLSCEIQSKWTSRDGADFTAYFDASQSPKGLPPMGGYLVGYLVAQDLGKTHTVAELAKMQISELEPLMRTRIASLCATGAI